MQPLPNLLSSVAARLAIVDSIVSPVHMGTDELPSEVDCSPVAYRVLVTITRKAVILILENVPVSIILMEIIARSVRMGFMEMHS